MQPGIERTDHSTRCIKVTIWIFVMNATPDNSIEHCQKGMSPKHPTFKLNT